VSSCEIVYRIVLFNIDIIYFHSRRVWLQVHWNGHGDQCGSCSSSEILTTWRYDFIACWRRLHTLWNILVFCFATSGVLRSTWKYFPAPEMCISVHSACSRHSGSFGKNRCGCSELLSHWVMTSEPFYILLMVGPANTPAPNESSMLWCLVDTSSCAWILPTHFQSTNGDHSWSYHRHQNLYSAMIIEVLCI